MVFRRTWLICSMVCLLLCIKANGQGKSARDTILLGAVVEGKDTIPMIFLPDVNIIDKLPKRFVKAREKYNRLYYNVLKVYPYANIAADVLQDVDVNLIKLSYDKKASKAYMKTIEAELNKRFKGELEDMTIEQGRVLVKLIDRQTGKNCYHIIKELKGGFSAVIWQGVALLFGNSLKKEYDPLNDDKDIEGIVKELESANYHRYKYQLQQAQLQTRK